jgi:hypothetical protein
MIIDAQSLRGLVIDRPCARHRQRRFLRPFPLPAASSGRQVGALIIIQGPGWQPSGYLRGRVTRLLADPGQSAARDRGDRIPSEEVRADGKHLPPLSHGRGAICQ